MKTEQLNHYNTPKTPAQTSELVLICDGVNSPANAGSLFRLADALGIKKLIFYKSRIDLNSNRLKRTSRSCEKRVAFSICDNLDELLASLREEDFQFIGLELTTTSVALNQFETACKKVALVLGNEQHGISQLLLDHLDHLVHIPMQGVNSSMNVSHAAAIAVYNLINGTTNE